MSRAPRRGNRLPRGRTPSSSGCSGRATDGARSTADTGLCFGASRARGVSASCHVLTERAKCLAQRRLELGIAAGSRSRRRAHEVRAAGEECVGVHTGRGPQAPAYPIAHDRATDLAPDRIRRRAAAPSTVPRPRTQPSPHLDGGAGPEPGRETLIAHEPAKSGRQARAALGPTAPQNSAPGLRPHTQAEAVLLAALAIVWLKRPLHAWPPRTPEPQTDGAPGARRATASLKSAMSQRHTAATGAGTARANNGKV